jgi:hypothetical protein
MGWSTIITSDRTIPQETIDRIASRLPGHLAGPRIKIAWGWHCAADIHNPVFNELRISGAWWSADKGPSFTHHVLEQLAQEGHRLSIKRSDLMETRHKPTANAKQA